MIDNSIDDLQMSYQMMAIQLVLIDSLIINYKKKFLNLYIFIFQLLIFVKEVSISRFLSILSLNCANSG